MRRFRHSLYAILILILLFQPLLSFPASSIQTAKVVFTFVTDQTFSFETVSSELEDYGFNDFDELMCIPEESHTRYLYSSTYVGTDLASDLIHLNDLAFIEDVSPDEILYIDSSTDYNDVSLSQQWHLVNIGAFDAYDALASGSTPGEDVVVAVIDTGIDYDHEDLKDSLWVNETELNGYANYDDDKNGYKDDIYGINLISTSTNLPNDDEGHGTHVSGIIAATARNRLGGIGISYGSKIMSIKAGDSSGEFSTSNLIKALNYAVKNGANIINMSLGGENLDSNSTFKTAVDAASKSCLLVAAAGNGDDNQIGLPTKSSSSSDSADIYPAAFEPVLGVMATNNSNQLTSFSNFDYLSGDNVDYEIAAPGYSIYSTVVERTKIGASLYNYSNMSGTSMAAPIVSAAAATLLKYFKTIYPNNDKVNSELIKSHLIQSTAQLATKSYNNATLTYPKLNLFDAIKTPPQPDVIVNSILLYNSYGVRITDTSALSVNEEYYFQVILKNNWASASQVNLSLTCDNPLFTLVNKSVSIDSLDTYDSVTLGNYSTQRIGFTITSALPEDAAIPLTLTVHSKNGLITTDTKEYNSSKAITIGAEIIDTSDQLYPIRTLTLSPSSSTLIAGKTVQLSAIYTPTNTTDSLAFTWTSSNPTVASVDKNGLVTAHQKGLSIISIVSSNQKTSSCTIIVTEGFLPVGETNPPEKEGSPTSTSLPTPLPSVITELKKPSAPRVTKLSSSSSRIVWTKLEDAKSYTLYRSTKKSGHYKQIAKLKSSSKSYYVDKSIRSDVTYYYKIKATSALDGTDSKPSNSTYFLICKQVSNLKSIKRSTNQYKISWSKYKYAAGYVLYYSNKKTTGYHRLGSTQKNHILLNKKANYINILAYSISSGKKIVGSPKILKLSS